MVPLQSASVQMLPTNDMSTDRFRGEADAGAAGDADADAAGGAVAARPHVSQ
jgi:hypothetical protein